MITALLRELDQAGVNRAAAVAVADAQFWNEQHMDDVTAEHGIQVLIPPDSGKREGDRPGWTGGRYAFMRRCSRPTSARELYRKRKQTDRAHRSVTPNTTAASTASTDAAGPPSEPSGD